MSDPALFRLRCSFRKQGRLALLSHLEVAHALERAVRRANVPFAVSQGFSPHMRIAFGAALPVGVGGTQEIFDLLLTEYVPADEMLEKLSAASSEDLMVLSCSYVEHNATAASVVYPFSTYQAVLSAPIQAISAPESITVVRKKKEKTIVVQDYLCGDIAVEGAILTFTLEAKPTGSLRPDLLVSECLKMVDNPPLVQSITRVEQKAFLD